MQIELRYLSEKDKKEICGWKYDGKYAMYNLSDHEQMRREQCGFFNPEKEEEYCGTWEDGELVGFVHVCPGIQKITIGLGVRPELCGKHYGTTILKLVCEEVEKQYPGRLLCLYVRCRTDFADIQNKKECGGNRQWQNHYLRNWAANTKGKGII